MGLAKSLNMAYGLKTEKARICHVWYNMIRERIGILKGNIDE